MADENVYNIDVSGALTSLAALQKGILGTNRSIKELSLVSSKFNSTGELLAANLQAITKAGSKVNIQVQGNFEEINGELVKVGNSVKSISAAKPIQSLDELSKTTQALLANTVRLSQATDKIKIPEIALKTPTPQLAGLGLSKENVTFGNAAELKTINSLLAEFKTEGQQAGISQKRLSAAIRDGKDSVRALIGDNKQLGITYDLLLSKSSRFASEAAKGVKIPRLQEEFGATTAQIAGASPTETKSLNADIKAFTKLQDDVATKQKAITETVNQTKIKQQQLLALETQLNTLKENKPTQKGPERDQAVANINQTQAQINKLQKEITKEERSTNAELQKTADLEARILGLKLQISQKTLTLGTPKFEPGALESALGATKSKRDNASPIEQQKLNQELVKFIELASRSSVTAHDIDFAIKNADNSTVKLIGNQKLIADQFIKARNAANELGQEIARNQAISNRSSQVNKIFNKLILPKLPAVDLDLKTSSGTVKEIDAAKAKSKELLDFLVANTGKGRQSIEKAFSDLAALAANPKLQIKSSFSKDFLHHFVELNNAYAQIGVSAAKAAAEEQKYKNEVIARVSQSRNARNEDAAIAKESIVQTERLKAFAKTGRTITPEIRKDTRLDKQVVAYDREFSTIDTSASKFNLVAADVDILTEALKRNDLSLLQGREDLNDLASAVSTFASSYTRLKEKVDQVTAADKAQAEALVRVLELEKARQAITANTNKQRGNITNELFNKLPPIQSEVTKGVFQTNIDDKQLSAVQSKIVAINNVLKEVELEDVKVGEAFRLAFDVPRTTEADIKALALQVANLDPATRRVYDAFDSYGQLVKKITTDNIAAFNSQNNALASGIKISDSRIAKINEEFNAIKQGAAESQAVFIAAEAKKEAATAARIQKEREASAALLAAQKDRALVAAAESGPRRAIIDQAQAKAPALESLDDKQVIVLTQALNKVNTVLEKTNVDVSIVKGVLNTAFTSNASELINAIQTIDPLLKPILLSFVDLRKTVDSLKSSVNSTYEEFIAEGSKLEAKLNEEKAKIEETKIAYDDKFKVIAIKQAAAVAAQQANIAKLDEELRKTNALKDAQTARREAFKGVVETQFQPLNKPIDKGLVSISSDQTIAINKALSALDITIDKTNLDASQLGQVFRAFNGESIKLVDAEQLKLLNSLLAVKHAYNDVFESETRASSSLIKNSKENVKAIARELVEVRNLNKARSEELTRRAEPFRAQIASSFLEKRPELQFPPEVPSKIQRKLTTSQLDVSKEFAKSKAKVIEFALLYEEAFSKLNGKPSELALAFGPLFKALSRLANEADKASESFKKSFTGIAAPIQKEILDLVTKSKFSLDALKHSLSGSAIASPIGKLDADLLTTKIKSLGDVFKGDAKLIEGAVNEIIAAHAKEIASDEKRTNKTIANAERKREAQKIAQAAQAKNDIEIGEAFKPIIQQFKIPKFVGSKEQILEVRDAFVALTQQVIKTNTPIDSLKARLAELLKARELLAKGKIFELPPVSAETETLNQSLLRTHDSLEAAGTAGSRAGQRITLSFQGLLRLLQVQVLHTFIFNIISEFQQAITASGEFEQKIALVRTIADGAAGSFDTWAKSLREVSDILGKPSVEIAAAAYDSLSNQITTSAADTARFTTIAGQFARVTGSTVPDSVNLLSSAINSFGLSSSDAESVASGFFNTIDKGRVKANELANNFGRTSSFAKALGISLSEVEAGLVVITQAGVKSAEAQTQLNAIFSKLIKPTKDLQDLLNSLGIASGEELIQAKGLGGAIQFLAQAAHEGKIEITDVFNEIRGSKGFFALATNGTENFAKALKDVEPNVGRFKSVIEEFNKPAGVQLQISLQKIKNYITDDLGRGAVESLVHFSNTFGGLDKNFQQFTVVVGVATKAAVLFGSASAAAFAANKAYTGLAILGTAIETARVEAGLATTAMGYFTASTVAANTASRSLGATLTGLLTKNAAFVAFAASFAAVSTAIYYAKASVNDLNDAFDQNKDLAIKDSEQIAQAIAANSASSTDAIKKNLDEQLTLYTNQTIAIRKELSNQAEAQKEVTAELGGQLGNAFKSTLDQLKGNTTDIKKRATETSKSADDIEKDQINRGQNLDKKNFERQLVQFPRHVVPLTLQRADALSNQATNFLSKGNTAEGLQTFKEAENLIEGLLDKFPRAAAAHRKLIDQFNAKAIDSNNRTAFPDANLSKLNRATARLQDKQFDPVDITSSKKSNDQRIKDIQEVARLTENANRKNFNKQVSVQTDIAKINKQYSALDQSSRPSVEQALINLTAKELAIKELMIAANREEAATLNQVAVTQDLLTSEAQRFFTEANKIKSTSANGEFLSSDELNKAIASIQDFKDKTLKTIEEIAKSQAKLFDNEGKPIVDLKLLNETKKRFETLFDAKIGSLTKEVAIQADIKNVEKLKNAIKDSAEAGVRHIGELTKQFEALALSINNAAGNLSNFSGATVGAAKNALTPSIGQSIASNIGSLAGITDTTIEPVRANSNQTVKEQLDASNQLIKTLDDLDKAQKHFAEIKNVDVKIDTAKKTVARTIQEPIENNKAVRELNSLLEKRNNLVGSGGDVKGQDILDKTNLAIAALDKLRDIRAKTINDNKLKGIDADAAGNIDVLGQKLRSRLRDQKLQLFDIKDSEIQLQQINRQINVLGETLKNPNGKLEELNKLIKQVSFAGVIGEAKDFAQAIRDFTEEQRKYNKLLDNKNQPPPKTDLDKLKAAPLNKTEPISAITGLHGLLASTVLGAIKIPEISDINNQVHSIKSELLTSNSKKILPNNDLMNHGQINTNQFAVNKSLFNPGNYLERNQEISSDNQSQDYGISRELSRGSEGLLTREVTIVPQLEPSTQYPITPPPNTSKSGIPPTLSQNSSVDNLIGTIGDFVTNDTKSKPFQPKPFNKDSLDIVGKKLDLTDLFSVDQLKTRFDKLLADFSLPPATKEQIKDLAQALHLTGDINKNFSGDVATNFRDDQGLPKFNDTDKLIKKAQRQLNDQFPQQPYPENNIALAANNNVAKIDFSKIFDFEAFHAALNKALSELKLPQATNDQAQNFQSALGFNNGQKPNYIKVPNSFGDTGPPDKPASGVPSIISIEKETESALNGLTIKLKGLEIKPLDFTTLQNAISSLVNSINEASSNIGQKDKPAQGQRYGGLISYYNLGGMVEKPKYMNSGGLVPAMLAKGEMVIPPEIAKNNMPLLNHMNYFNNGGFVPRGLDTIPAMLREGSYVLNPRATQNFTPILRATTTSSSISHKSSANSTVSNFGDIHINMQGGTKNSVSQFAQELKRASRQGRINLS